MRDEDLPIFCDRESHERMRLIMQTAVDEAGELFGYGERLVVGEPGEPLRLVWADTGEPADPDESRCAAAGCAREDIRRNGLCVKHYSRLERLKRKHGSFDIPTWLAAGGPSAGVQ